MRSSFKRLIDESVSRRHFLVIITGATGVQLFGYLTLFLFAVTTSGGNNWGEILAITVMIGASAFLVGFVLGFIFGVPRVSEEPAELIHAILTNPESLKTSRHIPFKYRVNTNLEQVSDWLTKILVGIGLTQFNTFRQALGEISAQVAMAIPGLQYAEPIIAGSVVFFSLIGFLEGYLLARVVLPGVFTRSEEDVHNLKANLGNLINLKLDFTPDEEDLLKIIITKFEEGSEFTLSDEFVRESKQHSALLSLEQRYLVNPKEGEDWGPGKCVELTPIAQAILQKLKKKVLD